MTEALPSRLMTRPTKEQRILKLCLTKWEEVRILAFASQAGARDEP